MKENQRTGVGARTLAEKRKVEDDKRKVEEKAEALAKKENISFTAVFEKYIGQAIQDKNHRTCLDEQSKFNKWLAPLFRDMPMKDISRKTKETNERCRSCSKNYHAYISFN